MLTFDLLPRQEMAEQEDEGCVIIEIDTVLLETMKAKLRDVDFAEESGERCTMYRILPSVRDKDSEDYDPKAVSIGPLHAGKKTLELMESLKWRYLRDLLRRCPDDQGMLERYINKVRELEVQARKKYAEAVEPDSDAFVQMMVVDACFIIEFLIKWNYGSIDLDASKCNLRLLRNDLMLLENQIPFFILHSLFELSNIRLPHFEDEDIPITLMKLARSYVADEYENFLAILEPENVRHLLHLFHLSFHPTPSQSIMTAPSCRHMVMSTTKKIRNWASGCFFWLLSSFLCCRLLPKCSKYHHRQLTDERLRLLSYLPSATKLEESGVKFKRKEAMSLLDVTFRDGVLEIPLLSIDSKTAPKFRNLIAFEQYCPTAGKYFTSYAALLDSLVDTPKDVAVLKKYGVIDSKLSQDDKVADLFNSIDKGAYLNYWTHHFAKLFEEVNQY